jgi:putative tryptophan/tyrosine transport system substrate-binding protein
MRHRRAAALAIVAAHVWLFAPAVFGQAPEAIAQPSGKVVRLGVIGERGPGDPWHESLRQGLHELGYVEGQNIVIESRFANGIVDRFPDLATDLVNRNVDVLVVGGALSTRAAMSVTTTVPIVFTQVGDPVAAGLVASLSRPGGNATGLSNVIVELTAKQLELLKATAPRTARVAILHNPQNSALALRVARESARALRIELREFEVRRPNDLAPTFSQLAANRIDAVLALSDPVFGSQLTRMAKLAADRRLPAMYSRREYAEAGGLLAYGPDFAANYRRAAHYVDKIIKGAKPGDLPVEQPTRFEFVVNLKTAKALGLVVPPSLLQRADQVID